MTGRGTGFFELLKAAHGLLEPLAKPTPPRGRQATTPEGYQQRRTISWTPTLRKIAANIVDQFDFDGYPTRIIFNDGNLFGGRNLVTAAS